MNPDLHALWGILHRQRIAAATGLLLTFLASILFSPVIHSAQQPPTQLYEGLKVSSVDLVAQPTMKVEDFRPLVTQKVQTPYSNADIQKTAAALQRTGKFSKVEIEIEPEADGLRVIFILEPVFYVGMIYFPGATKEFSYSRLLQVVNYPDQAPFEGVRADQGEKSLTRFFAQQGYFAAQVKVETKLAQARKLADIVYDVTLGRRAKIGDIEISGAPPPRSRCLKVRWAHFVLACMAQM